MRFNKYIVIRADLMEELTCIETNQELDKQFLYMRNRWRGNYRNSLHSHNGFEIFYFHQGTASYIVGDGVYQLKPGDMLIFNGRVPHQVFPSDDEPYVRSFINFIPSLCEKCLPEDILNTLIGLFNSTHGLLIHWEGSEKIRIEQLIEEMVHEFDEESCGFFPLTKAYLSQLLIKIYRKSKDAIKTSIEAQSSQKEKHVLSTLRYLSDHFRENVTLDQLANELHVNKHYLCHIFKEVTGFTINKYLTSRKIEEAKSLLVTTNDPIGIISENLGFNSAVHFSRLFKQYIDISPQMYRKKFNYSYYQLDYFLSQI
ncbi:AraC family transcriptional regulator [Salipaludibacillus neizhouensis]|uniref:AraC family transcriptional regulator n=1 Tax=Salipaludibacillus neizhouensis TaxID=885475 RepID=A0A3A9JZ10_9BACI|nr:AraC family transcriptional regulator [Salipaludibacillus neizhouensis]RKL65727.1 AraC family transcriptional regulator [Salipaludibacillus neizhouensis]